MDQPSVLEDPKYSYLVNVQPFLFRLWKKLFDIYCRFVFLWYTPLKITGQNNLPDSSYIFSCNHNSHMDVAILSVASGRGFNDFGMLAAKDYWFDSWVKRFVVNIVMNLIPIDRKADGTRAFPIEDTLSLCRAFMGQGKKNIIMFPEGTRGEPGVILPFRKGVANFAINLDVPIVPAFIVGSDKAWPKGKIFIRPRSIHAHILAPLYPKDFIDVSQNGSMPDQVLESSIEHMTQELEKRIREKGEELYG